MNPLHPKTVVLACLLLTASLIYGQTRLQPDRFYQAGKTALDPKNKSVYYNRGGIYFIKKDYPHAVDDFTKLIALDTAYADAYKLRSNAYFAQSDYTRTLRDLDKGIELEPNNNEAYFIRGSVYQRLGKQEQADADLKKAEALKVKN
ncbi:tetratricopeptide repeat protein [Niabella hirudinis]|uniref:tetratricopeptide repeat protein n=1 Tax=Niabella hirudinis TaxID=1285929 RepID=UPI003EB796E7